MKKTITILAILFFANAFGQTIDIGPDEYAFQYTTNPNFGLFFNASDVRYEFLNGGATTVFGISAQNGRFTTDLEFESTADYLVGNNRYAFRAGSDPDFGLFFNASTLSYDFRDNTGNAAFSIGANSGNLTTSGFIAPGNTSSTTNGIIRYNGSDLQGRVGGQWKSLTTTGAGGAGSLQDAFEVGNTINTNAEPLLIEGFEGFIVSQGTSASTEGIGVKMFFDPTNISFRCGSVNATAWNDENRGAGSVAFGLSTIASGLGSFASGNATEASGEYCFSAGFQSEASGNYSAAFGEGGLASGDATFIAGKDNTASGLNSAAFGRSSDASGQTSFASGNGASAIGSSSAAMGSNVDAAGDVSAAFGFSTDANGFGSFAAGWASKAEGDGSVAFGRGSIAKSAHETVIGSFNTEYTANSTTANDDNDRLFVIGNGTSSSRSDALVMLKNGNLGLGTDNPSAKLTVDEVAVGTDGIRLRGGSNYLAFDNWQIGQAQDEGSPVVDGDLVLRRSGTARFNFWTSYFAPVVDNSSSLGRSSQRWSTIYSSNGTINTSDSREKKNIKKLDYGLETLMKLKPVSYEWIDDVSNMGTKLGFVAQDLLKVVPEVVVTQEPVENRETGEVTYQEAERMGVFYDDLIPVLTKAIQEQQGTIEELTEENEKLMDQLENVLNRMDLLEHDLVSCCFDSQSNQTNGGTSSENGAELGQNIPNPFSESTVIRYYLPEGTTNAIIRITNMEGSPVEDLQLGATRGANQVEFQTQGLASGTYLYSLFIDGKFIDTKKMMITK